VLQMAVISTHIHSSCSLLFIIIHYYSLLLIFTHYYSLLFIIIHYYLLLFIIIIIMPLFVILILNNFLDKNCLVQGQDWEAGFTNGIQNSRCILVMISDLTVSCILSLLSLILSLYPFLISFPHILLDCSSNERKGNKRRS
jgi:hypothetical protein